MDYGVILSQVGEFAYRVVKKGKPLLNNINKSY